MEKCIAHEETLFYEEFLKKRAMKTEKLMGRNLWKKRMIREHKNVFAYAIETACDKNGWILGYTINPGNEHDSRTFKGLYDKIKGIGIKTLVADAGYKTPAIQSSW